jgi:hypothetical protein
MPVVAYVLVNMRPGTSHEIITYRKIPGVKISNSVFGRYDAVLVVSAKNVEELSKTIYEVIERHPQVEHTECLVTLPYPPEAMPRISPRTHRATVFACPICNSLNRRGSTSCPLCGYPFPESRQAKGLTA